MDGQTDCIMESRQQLVSSETDAINDNMFALEGDPSSEMLTPVQQMFNGRSVFITGASGFIGRVLLEKLLRTYTGIKRVYILLRPKKNLSPQERLSKHLFNIPIFDHIKSMKNGQDLLDKVVVISGDIGEKNLGISEADLETMLNDETLSIVFHSAATVKFDEPLKTSVQLNLVATKTIIDLCKQLKNLVCLCHVSTAYANSDIKDNRPIEEKIYPLRQDPNQVIKLAELMDENLMQQIKGDLVGERPNTYTYTKALAEHLIANEASNLPVAIVRPSIVVAAWKEPLEGWIDNLNGPTGLILAIGKGLLRTMYTRRDVKADMIPVDVAVNTIIAAGYYAAKTFKANKSIKEQVESVASKVDNLPSIENVPKETLTTDKSEASENGMKIFHCTSGDINPITWGRMEDMFFPIIRNYPSEQVLRYPFGTFKQNKYHDLVTRLFVHYLPALIIDLLCMIMGKKRQLLSIYYKLHFAIGALSHFTTTNYNFKSDNCKLLTDTLDQRDKKDLYIDISSLDWFRFWDRYVLGARRFVLKEKDHTLDEARRSFRRAYYVEMGIRTTLIIMAIACYLVLNPRFNLISPFRGAFHALGIVG